jgi:hypothetical protein
LAIIFAEGRYACLPMVGRAEERFENFESQSAC